MKKISTLVTLLFVFGYMTMNATVYLKFYNGDSKDAIYKVKSCGSTTEVKFDHSTTSSVTIQTGCDDAVLITPCGEVKVKNNQKVTIKNGCVTVEN